jgi:hypothetical protein
MIYVAELKQEEQDFWGIEPHLDERLVDFWGTESHLDERLAGNGRRVAGAAIDQAIVLAGAVTILGFGLGVHGFAQGGRHHRGARPSGYLTHPHILFLPRRASR